MTIKNKDENIDEKVNNIMVNSEIKAGENVKNGDEIGSSVELKNTEMVSKGYTEIAKEIIAKEGLGGLFGRGLQVR